MRAVVAVGRVRDVATRVANTRADDAVELTDQVLHAPEAPTSKDRRLGLSHALCSFSSVSSVARQMLTNTVDPRRLAPQGGQPRYQGPEMPSDHARAWRSRESTATAQEHGATREHGLESARGGIQGQAHLARSCFPDRRVGRRPGHGPGTGRFRTRVGRSVRAARDRVPRAGVARLGRAGVRLAGRRLQLGQRGVFPGMGSRRSGASSPRRRSITRPCSRTWRARWPT